jgi:hypothetical protein
LAGLHVATATTLAVMAAVMLLDGLVGGFDIPPAAEVLGAPR